MILTRDRGYYRELIKLAPPIMLGNLLTFSIGFTDHFMTSSLGTEAISGIYLANQVGMLLQFLSVGVESALAIVGAQCHGEGERTSRIRYTVAALAVGEALAVLLTIICIFAPKTVLSLFSDKPEIIDTGARFLRILSVSFPIYTASRILIASARSGEHAGIALIAPAVSFGVNLALNATLIYGFYNVPAMGVTGAAIATLAARSAELVAALIYTVRALKKDGISGKSIRPPSGEEMVGYIKCAAPILGGQLVWAAGNLFTSALMSRVDGGSATASVGVALSLGNLAYTLMNAASASVGVIISRSVGKGESREKIMEYANTSELLFLALGIIACFAILALSGAFTDLYRLEGEARETAHRLISVVAFTFIAISYSAASLFGIIKSGGDVTFTAICDLCHLVFLTLPLGMLAYRLGASPTLLFIALRVEHVVKCIVARIKIGRGDWMHRVCSARVDKPLKK